MAIAVRVRCLLGTAAVMVLVPTVSHGQDSPPECKVINDASYKQVMTPNHLYMTTTGSKSRGLPPTIETITAGDVVYMKGGGDAWVRMPTSPQQMLAGMKDAVRGMNATCRKVRDEAVDGTSAMVYEVHNQMAAVKTVGQYWIGKSSGLVLRAEIDTDGGTATTKTHQSIRAEYTNIKAPPVSK